MAWIKFEKDLLTDPRVLRIAHNLCNAPALHGCNAPAFDVVTLVCGALTRLWSLADTHLGPDDVLPLGIIEIDKAIGVPGFCALMPEDWLIPIDGNTVKLPEFLKHNGIEAKKKASTQKRVARLRKKRNAIALQPQALQALPDQDQDKTKTRPSNNVAHINGMQSLIALGVDEQVAYDWIAIRKAKRAPVTETVLSGLKREAEKAGISVAQAVAICARKSWQGFNASWDWQDGSKTPDYSAVIANLKD